jgi:hypothetical protein
VSPPPIHIIIASSTVNFLYGFGDASKGGFGWSIDFGNGVSFEFGEWCEDIQTESSSYHEFRNFVNALMRAAVEVRLKGAEILLFTDNQAAAGAYYRCTSPSPALFELVVTLYKLQMKYYVLLHSIWTNYSARKNHKVIHFNCACATLIQTHEGLNRRGATILSSKMHEELCSLVSRCTRVLVDTDPKVVCPFQFYVMLLPHIVSPVMTNTFCYCVVVFVRVPLFACGFLENCVICFVSRCVLQPVFQCLDGPPFWCHLCGVHHYNSVTVVSCGLIVCVSYLVPNILPEI